MMKKIKNCNSIVSKADKGNALVILGREDCDNKVNSVLQKFSTVVNDELNL